MICSLSLDGTAEMHNLNRCNSFSNIDIDFFKTTYPNQSCKMTISDLTLPYLYEGIIYLQELGFTSKISFAQGIEWNKESLNLLEIELQKLIEYYSSNDLPLCDLLDKNLLLVATTSENRKWCGMGNHLKAYDINGNIYPCQAFAPNTLGHKISKQFINAKESDFSFDYTLDNPCSNCVIERLCPNCYGANFQKTGNHMTRDYSLCNFQKAIILAVSKLRFNKLSKKSKLSNEEYIELNNILKIQKNINYISH